MAESLPRNQILIKNLTEIILTNLGNESFGVKELAQESGLSRYSLNSKLLAATQKTASQFIREIRLRKAMEMLKNEDLTASEVAYKTGFSSPNYFNTCFHEFFGYPPGKVKKGEPENMDEGLGVKFTPGQKPKESILQAFPYYKTWIAVLSVIIGVIAIIIYPKIFTRGTLDDLRSLDGRISVAVMPFRNLTNDTIWNVWQVIIQENLSSSLSDNPEELTVRQPESINSLLGNNRIANYTSITPSAAKSISQKLDAKIFINGSIQQEDSLLRISAQLIDSKTGIIIRSFELDGHSGEKHIMPIIDLLKKMLTDYLVISKRKMDVPPVYRIKESPVPDAYKYYIYGQYAMMEGDFSTALEMYSEAVKNDSAFNKAIIGLTIMDLNLGKYKEAKKMASKVYERLDQMPLTDKYDAEWIHSLVFGTPGEAILCLRHSLEIDDQRPGPYYLIGKHYNALYQYNKAIPEFVTALDLYKKWNTKPGYDFYTALGLAYHKNGQLKEQKKLYRKAEKDHPGNGILLLRQSVLALTEGDTIAANKYIEKFISVRKDQLWSEVRITTNLAIIYDQAGILDKAQEYYRQALSFDPENSESLNNLAYFLIDKDRNISGGLDLVDKAQKLSPDDYASLHSKGWGLYKLGKYKEALNLLTKSDSLKPIYNHDLYLHLEAAKKAVASQKRTDR